MSETNWLPSYGGKRPGAGRRASGITSGVRVTVRLSMASRRLLTGWRVRHGGTISAAINQAIENGLRGGVVVGVGGARGNKAL